MGVGEQPDGTGIDCDLRRLLLFNFFLGLSIVLESRLVMILHTY
jgi:hypothetical protein